MRTSDDTSKVEAAEPADDHGVDVHVHQPPHQQVRLDCVERRRKVQAEHPGGGLWLLQIFQNGMDHSQIASSVFLSGV